MARVLPNKQSVDECCHNWFTDSSESENEGRHRASRNMRSTDAPFTSRAHSDRSPMTVQGCVRPSTPVTRSVHGLVFTSQIFTAGMYMPCTSTVNHEEFRRWRDANNALALVAGGGDVVGGGTASTFVSDGGRVVEGRSAEIERTVERVAGLERAVSERRRPAKGCVERAFDRVVRFDGYAHGEKGGTSNGVSRGSHEHDSRLNVDD
eukprot:2071121-Pleurochrysis_carterae.AAC.2